MFALRILRTLLILAIVTLLALMLFAFLRRAPDTLDLADTSGPFIGRKLTALTGDAPACKALLDRAGIHYSAAPKLTAGAQCGYADGVRLTPGGARAITLAPSGLVTSCAIAATLAAWEWNVVQPAALRWFGRGNARIDHFGSYSCRRIGTAREGGWSEHATADAIDVAGFRLDDGTRITVAGDWKSGGRKAAFLRDVRDGACGLFATTLSPDYNAAHRDHLHLDQAARGSIGWRACR